LETRNKVRGVSQDCSACRRLECSHLTAEIGEHAEVTQRRTIKWDVKNGNGTPNR
jgi:hypothetical protein